MFQIIAKKVITIMDWILRIPFKRDSQTGMIVIINDENKIVANILVEDDEILSEVMVF